MGPMVAVAGKVAWGMVQAVIYNPKFWEWVIRFAGKKLVKSTKETWDDEAFAKFEELLDGKAK